MSLKRFAPRVRSRLRWHGWMIVAVCVVTGWACSSVLWHALHLTSMGLRYGLTAGVVYAALLVSLRTWLDWVHADALAHPDDWAAATPDEQAAQHEHEQSMRRSTERSTSMLDWGGNLLDFGEAAVIVLIPALILLILGFAGLVGGPNPNS